ncbi:hypothetical protein Tco_0770372 [Tanacetum coccineum]|uniref:Uncharacterized protein n=1 Tax=Tanacetum coccineum TaxID=301880 RepID=A0ABQ4ZEP2_9ASTR
MVVVVDAYRWGGHNGGSNGVVVGCGYGNDVGGGGVDAKVTRMAVEVAAVVGDDGGTKIYGGVRRGVGSVGRRSAEISPENG